jgi:gliding motility-associated protein GldM
MAAGKQDSRQKMINMMYLVFIAMLALNISKEVLATLGLLNDDIESSIAAKDAKSKKLYENFEIKKSDPSYVFPTKWAEIIIEATDNYFDFIEDSLKNKLLIDKETGKNKYQKTIEVRNGSRQGDTLVITDYQTMDKSNDLDELFFDGDNVLELGQKYVNNLKIHSDLFLSIIDSIKIKEIEPGFQGTEHDFSRVKNILDLNFKYQDTIINSSGTSQDYLDFNFKGFPKIASLSKFTKLQSDIKELELQMLEALSNKISNDGNQINENTSKTLLDSRPSYFVGQRTEGAKIIVGRIAGNFEPADEEIYINGQLLVEGTDYEMGGGAVNINKVFRKSGEKRITGNLFFKESDGSLTPIPIEQSLFINNRSDFFVEVPTMNILYRGLPNEIRVIDPEINQSNMRISSNSAEIINLGNNSYDVVPNKTAKEITVTVTDRSNSSVRKQKKFRVKNFPKMIPAISYNNRQYTKKTGITKIGLQRGKLTGSTPDDFDYPLEIVVTSFTFQIGNSPSTKINSNNLSKAFATIEASGKGTTASFTNVVSTAYYTKKGRKFPIEGQKLEDFTIKIM